MTVPSLQQMRLNLLDDILFKINVELKVPVVAISGNHDSAERLSFGSSWYRHSQLYLTGKLQKEHSTHSYKWM